MKKYPVLPIFQPDGTKYSLSIFNAISCYFNQVPQFNNESHRLAREGRLNEGRIEDV